MPLRHDEIEEVRDLARVIVKEEIALAIKALKAEAKVVPEEKATEGKKK